MFEVRIHGRGGQGVVTAAELLSVAAFTEGRHAQAFPTFGSERTGAPVVSFCRISEHPIRSREPIADPDGLIVVDPTLVHQVALFEGLSEQGYMLLNSSHSLEHLGLGDIAERLPANRAVSVDATDIARDHIGRPLPNAAMLGGFAALSGIVGLDSVTAAIRERFPGSIGDRNVAAAEATFAAVPQPSGAPAHA